MVQSDLVGRFDTVVSVMTKDEALSCVAMISHHMNSARAQLHDLYERRGWVALGYASWRECVETEFGQSQNYLYRQLNAAEIESRILPNGKIGTIPEGQLRPLTKLTPMEQPVAWQEANERSGGKPTARVVEQVVREFRGIDLNSEEMIDLFDSAERAELSIYPDDEQDEVQRIIDGRRAERAAEDDALDPPLEEAQAADIRKSRTNAGLFTSATPEWYTPNHIIDRVEKVFGEIDLDPCSNAKGEDANVPAGDHYTIDDDGLIQRWHGRVYMNPPYGDEIGQWTARLIKAHADQEIDEAIALLPARTDTAWFRPLMAHLCCFVHGRLKFSGADNSAPFPSVVVYLGPDHEGFTDAFEDIGTIMRKA